MLDTTRLDVADEVEPDRSLGWPAIGLVGLAFAFGGSVLWPILLVVAGTAASATLGAAASLGVEMPEQALAEFVAAVLALLLYAPGGYVANILPADLMPSDDIAALTVGCMLTGSMWGVIAWLAWLVRQHPWRARSSPP